MAQRMINDKWAEMRKLFEGNFELDSDLQYRSPVFMDKMLRQMETRRRQMESELYNIQRSYKPSFNWIAVDWEPTKQLNEDVKMNKNHLVEALLENFYTIGIKFDGSSKVYTYKVSKTIELEVEDKVIVESDYGMSIVEVTRVDEDIRIDFTANYSYKFIVQKLDTTEYDDLVAKDQRVAKALVTAESQQVRKNMIESLVGTMSEDQVKLLEEETGATLVKRL